MLIVSGSSRDANRRYLVRQLCQPRIPIRLIVKKSRLRVDAISWREYWRPCGDFFEADLCLVQRLNRLKKAWQNIIDNPSDYLSQITYCWRYFGLLHHTLRIAKEEISRPNPFPAIRRIVGFETFLLSADSETGIAAGTLTCRNPLFLLGRLIDNPMVSVPRHVPVLMPIDQNDLFYFYRQVQISGSSIKRIFVNPSVSLPNRPASFTPIDRLTRLVSEGADPYWKPRAKLLAKRLLVPLLHARKKSIEPLNILDIGAGTGQLTAKAWTYLRRLQIQVPPASFHFVDNNAPAFGRSFGLTRGRPGITHVEWTIADYRVLADDDFWLQKSGPFDWVFACRILDNTSNFMIETVEEGIDSDFCRRKILPHQCLSPRNRPDGINTLEISANHKSLYEGKACPQFSLRDYLMAISCIQNNSLDYIDEKWRLLIRRFNPASLITPSGRSLISQFLKVSQVIIIEDVDVEPEHLRQHKSQFGLSNTSAIFCTNDGFRTEANYYVITAGNLPEHLKGVRLW